MVPPCFAACPEIRCCKLQQRQRVRWHAKNAYAKGMAPCTPPTSGSRLGGWLRLVAQLAAARAAATALFFGPPKKWTARCQANLQQAPKCCGEQLASANRKMASTYIHHSSP